MLSINIDDSSAMITFEIIRQGQINLKLQQRRRNDREIETLSLSSLSLEDRCQTESES